MFEQAKLSDLAELAMGETIIAEDCDGTGFPIYSASTDEAPWNYSSRISRRLTQGTIVVGARCSIGFPRMPTSDKFGATQTTITVSARDDNVNPHFLFHALRHVDFKALTSQQAIPMLTVSEFGAVSLPRPPLAEQTKIVEVLNALDTTIRQTEAIVAKLKQVKQGLLHDLLTRGIDANSELRPPQSEAPHLYKESSLGYVPAAWEVDELANVVASSPNAIVDGPFGSNLKSEHYRSEGVPVIQSGYVTSGVFQADSYFHVTPQHFQSQARSRVDPGDVVMAKIGANAGMCAVLPSDHRFGILAGNCLKITTDDRVVRQDWLVRYLHRLYQTSGMSEVRTETAQPAISLGRIRKLLIPVPTVDEQARASEKLSAIERSLLTEIDLAAKLRTLKSGLMDDLLTGRVRVTPLLLKLSTTCP